MLGRLVNGERLSARWAQATVLAAVGVLLLAGDGGASVDPTGVGLAVTSGIGYATYTVLSKRMLDSGEAPEGVMAAGFGCAGLLLLPVLVVAGPGSSLYGGWRWRANWLRPHARPTCSSRAASPTVQRRDGDDSREPLTDASAGSSPGEHPSARRLGACWCSPGCSYGTPRAGSRGTVTACNARTAARIDRRPDEAVLRERILEGDSSQGGG